MVLEIHIRHFYPFNLIKEIKMISAEVQALLDQAKKNTSLVASVDLGLKAEAQQIADLQAQVAALPTGTALSDEDKAAIVEATADLAASNATLQADIPANTESPEAPAT